MKSYKKEKFKNKQDWKLHHSKFLGGSSAGILLNVSKWKTPLELYREIVSPSVEDVETTSENIVIGVSCEPLIRNTFKVMFPQYKVKDPKGWESYISTSRPYMGATVDGLLTEVSTGRKGILEIKTCDIRRKGDMQEWENKIPYQYYCQVLHYLMVMEDCQFVEIAAQLRLFDWSSENDNKIKELRTIYKHIEREDVQSDIDLLKSKEIEFWEKHIIPRVPPTYIRTIGEE